jgi:hypothetical protein
MIVRMQQCNNARCYTLNWRPSIGNVAKGRIIFVVSLVFKLIIRIYSYKCQAQSKVATYSLYQDTLLHPCILAPTRKAQNVR